MAKIKSFSVAKSRPLPVLILADVSGSMEADNKIATLNTAIAEMISTFAEEKSSGVEIQTGVITFGNRQARLHLPLTPSSEVTWSEMQAYGNTPLGAALGLAKEILEDKEQIPSRAYSPTLVLVSDGLPNDEWKQALEGLFESPRASKAMRMAIGIGEDADFSMLERFLNEEESRVFRAEEARQIHKFFRWVTLSVTQRGRSVNPNQFSDVKLPPIDEVKDF